MEALIEQLRKLDNWDESPDGFIGALFASSKFRDGAKILTRFIAELRNKGVNQPWF